MSRKLEAIKALELEEIREEDEWSEEKEEEEIRQNKRRTLLDKVVGDVFGKEKGRLYESKSFLKVLTLILSSVPFACGHHGT